MRRTLLPVFICWLLIQMACHSSNRIPDVSDIKVSLTTERFEKDLFDTSSANLMKYLQHLNTGSPSFTNRYFGDILNIDPRLPIDSTAAYVNEFIRAYRHVYDTAEVIFSDFTPYEKEISKGLQFVKYYFPEYKIPTKIITYIGPADGYGDILSEDALIIGLQHHLGKHFSLYQTTLVQETYAPFISNRFEPDYIAINCMMNIINDLYPPKEEDLPISIQMVDRGKRLYLLSKLLPYADENKLIGYTADQMKDCYKNEAVIWDLFVKNSLFQVSDKDVVKNYLDEGPKTQELGEDAPGNIGSFSGWQIVKKYMQNNPSLSLKDLLKTDNEKIFQDTKYKP